jgi:hypothetical protein
LADEARTQLLFALGKAYDDLHRFDEAFDALAEANALKRKTISYDEAETLAFFRRIQETYARRALFEFARVDPAGDPTPILIVGMPRSGTTLVEQIISSHPLVKGLGEARALEPSIREALSPARYPEAVASMQQHQLKAISQAYLHRLRLRAPDAIWMTDKTPANFYFLGLFAAAFPNAKIVHVRRDPADTCLSCFSKLFTAGQEYSYSLENLGKYYRAYADLMSHWRGVLPAHTMLEIAYEDVVCDTQEQAKRLLAHCGLEWDESVLRFHENRRPVSTASAHQVRNPIFSSSLQRWKNYERHLGALLSDLHAISVSAPAAG